MLSRMVRRHWLIWLARGPTQTVICILGRLWFSLTSNCRGDPAFEILSWTRGVARM